ncbi:Lacto-N-neotetraose biosynthesis glycosyltransferase [Sodalis praecaptivus]|uniref:Lacto-N-neotetraose biosynthesis glycosyltransferase n=1 Tax=Sodalis praecaptivus TaxID=1239307 RepID=W0HX08_9GAMM|nr:glycosyltransferase family 25 protein [Sodalis praecaptivus]AHF76688.1 Lacto-N-neotetraose biosynthesis glycosyltransferase [Sodalis praecaptivus]
MKVFIINLKASPKRRQCIEYQCQHYSLDYEFIEAINGHLLSGEDIMQHTRRINYATRPGEIGCALSHIHIYRLICERGLKQALILEDDAKLTPEAISLLPQLALCDIPSKPLLTLLTASCQYLKKPIQALDKTHCLHRVVDAAMTHGYIINRTAARNMAAGLYPVWMVADKFSIFQDYAFCQVRAVVPPVILHSIHAAQSHISITPKPDAARNAIWQSLKARAPWKVKCKHLLWGLLVRPFLSIVKQR